MIQGAGPEEAVVLSGRAAASERRADPDPGQRPVSPDAPVAGRAGEHADPRARSHRFAGYRLRRLLSAALGLLLLLIALWILGRWAEHVTFAELLHELRAIGATQIALAVGFTAASFAALVGYEWYAVRFTRRHLRFALVALYSFITQAIAHAAGFAIFVGATVRYKLYGGHGFDIFDVARIQLYFSTTFGLGIVTIGGLALALDPAPLAHVTGTSPALWRSLGLLALLGVAAVVFVASVLHRRVRILGHLVELPELRTTVLLILLGVGDLLGVAATLHVLLPADLALAFHETLSIFVAALALGLLSHVPGSLGVFEGAVVLLVEPAPEQAAALFGALIAFRAIYYILPLLVGALGFAAVELLRWLRPRAFVRSAPGSAAGHR